MSADITAETGMPAFSEPAERVLAAFDLLRTGRARNAILSGGSGAPAEAESRVIARQLEAWGIDGSRLALDERSLNTHENAVESVRIARERGWVRDVLVTSAAHVARAWLLRARRALRSIRSPSTSSPWTLRRRTTRSGFAARERPHRGSTAAIREGWAESSIERAGWRPTPVESRHDSVTAHNNWAITAEAHSRAFG